MQKLYQKFRSIELVRQFNAKRVQRESAFYEQNRREVLGHYRYLLKTVPSLYQRRLQQRSIYIEITHLFHQSKMLSSIHETRSRVRHLNTLVEEIKSGDFGNMGVYLPARQGEIEFVRHLFVKMRYRLSFE